LGKDGSFKLKQYMYNAQKAGQQAVTSRELRNKVLGLLGAGAGAIGLGELLTK